MFASFLLPADEYNTGYSEADWEIIEEIFRDFSMKLWVADDTYRLIYADINMKVEVSPEMMGNYDEEGRLSLNISIKTHCHHYNQSIDIDLPPKAENAEEASFW
jgi:hypothetical protein